MAAPARLSPDVEAQPRRLGHAAGVKIVTYAKELGWLAKPEAAEAQPAEQVKLPEQDRRKDRWLPRSQPRRSRRLRNRPLRDRTRRKTRNRRTRTFPTSPAGDRCSAPLAPRHERQPFEQMHVLLVLEQRAVQRRDQLLGIALAQNLRADVFDHQQLQPVQ